MIERQDKGNAETPGLASVVVLGLLGGALVACSFWLAWTSPMTIRAAVGAVVVMVFASEVIFQSADRARRRGEQERRRRIEEAERWWPQDMDETARLITRPDVDNPSSYDVWGR